MRVSENFCASLNDAFRCVDMAWRRTSLHLRDDLNEVLRISKFFDGFDGFQRCRDQRVNLKRAMVDWEKQEAVGTYTEQDQLLVHHRCSSSLMERNDLRRKEP